MNTSDPSGKNRDGHRGNGLKEIAKLLLAPAKCFLAVAKRHFGSFALGQINHKVHSLIRRIAECRAGALHQVESFAQRQVRLHEAAAKDIR
jgi:hypothetical protein